MFSSPEFSSPSAFEQVLEDTAANILSGDRASINRNQRVGVGSNALELDFVFEPYNLSGPKKIYIFEFKFSNSYTLADSLVYTQFARFSALRQANKNIQLKFLLVTNANIPQYLEIPEGVIIFSEIRDSNRFENEFRKWLSSELPGFRQTQRRRPGQQGIF